MANSVSFNPMLTTTNIGGFSVQSNGLVQGVAMDDPAVRYALAGGVLATNETLPMWGGVGIYANTPALGSTSTSVGPELGPVVGRATTVTANASKQLLGFSTFNQATAWINWPQSNVPIAAGGMTVPYFPLGSGARIAVQCDPSLAASLVGNSIGQLVYWDFNAQVLVASASSSYSVTSLTWSAINGGQVAVVTSAATPVAGVGDSFTLAGATNTGNGAVSAINTGHQVNTWTDSQHFTFLLPGDSTVWGTLGGTITLVYSEGALPVKVLRVQSGNSKVVVYDPVNNVCNWNNSGSAALIQI
jgi:hypothetical protein